MENYYCGVDVGTKNSVSAVANGSSVKVTYCESTFFAVDSEGIFRYGENAENILRLEGSDSVLTDLKRKIRNDPQFLNKEVTVGGQTLKVRKILSKIIENILKRSAQVQEDQGASGEIRKIVASYPCGLESGVLTASEYCETLHDIIQEITDLDSNQIFLQPEPVCIGYNLIANLKKTGITGDKTILVFDLGAGTLDFSVIKYTPQPESFEVLTTDGDLNLGGRDFTQVLIDDILSKEGVGIDLTDPIQSADLFLAVEEMKKRLSNSKLAAATLEIDDEIVTVKRSRDEFEELSFGLLNRIKENLSSLLARISYPIDYLFLSGGASQMPMIEEMIKKEFPDLVLEKDGNPETSVARGAALLALPSSDSERTSVVPFTYSVDCRQRATGLDRLYAIVFKDTPFKESLFVDSDIWFVPQHDSQKEVVFRIFESNYLNSTEKWHDYNLDGAMPSGIKISVPIPSTYQRRATEYKLFVKMGIDETGVFNFTITDINGKTVGEFTKSNVLASE